MPATQITPGKHRYELAFALPGGVPPSYRSRGVIIEYALAVHVAIPWWPDRTERYLVPVVAEPSAESGEPGVFLHRRARAAGQGPVSGSLARLLRRPPRRRSPPVFPPTPANRRAASNARRATPRVPRVTSANHGTTPFVRRPSSFVRRRTPSTFRASPLVRRGAPSTFRASPLVRRPSPKAFRPSAPTRRQGVLHLSGHLLRSTSLVVDSVGLARRPFEPRRTPFGLARQPFGLGRRPFEPRRKPFGLARQPFGLARRPFEPRRTSFGLARQPFEPRRKLFDPSPPTRRRTPESLPGTPSTFRASPKAFRPRPSTLRASSFVFGRGPSTFRAPAKAFGRPRRPFEPRRKPFGLARRPFGPPPSSSGETRRPFGPPRTPSGGPVDLPSLAERLSASPVSGRLERVDTRHPLRYPWTHALPGPPHSRAPRLRRRSVAGGRALRLPGSSRMGGSTPRPRGGGRPADEGCRARPRRERRRGRAGDRVPRASWSRRGWSPRGRGAATRICCTSWRRCTRSEGERWWRTASSWRRTSPRPRGCGRLRSWSRPGTSTPATPRRGREERRCGRASRRPATSWGP